MDNISAMKTLLDAYTNEFDQLSDTYMRLVEQHAIEGKTFDDIILKYVATHVEALASAITAVYTTASDMSELFIGVLPKDTDLHIKAIERYIHLTMDTITSIISVGSTENLRKGLVDLYEKCEFMIAFIDQNEITVDPDSITKTQFDYTGITS